MSPLLTVDLLPSTDSWWLGSGADYKNQLGSYAVNTLPGSRAGAFAGLTTTSAGATKLRLFGGQGAAFFASQGFLSDIWEWNVNSQQYVWRENTRSTQLNRASSYGDAGSYEDGSWPGGRAYGATWSNDRGAMIIYGGYGHAGSSTNGGLLADVFAWSESANSDTGGFAYLSGSQGTFQNVNYSTNATYATPGGRSRMAYGTWGGEQKGLIFGGDNGQARTSMNDVWAYDFSTYTWENLHAGCDTENVTWGEQGVESEDNCPPKLIGASGYVYLNNFYVFAGSYQNNTRYPTYYHNAVWRFNLETNAWTWIAGSNTTNVAGYYSNAPLAPRDIPVVTPVDTDDPERKRSMVRSLLEVMAPDEPGTPPAAPVAEPTPIEAPAPVAAVDSPVSVDSPTSTPVNETAPVAEPITVPSPIAAEPVEEPTTTPAPTAAPVTAEPTSSPTSTPTAPTSTPTASPTATSPVASPVASSEVDYPGSRVGAALQYYDGAIYFIAGLGYDAYGEFGNLNDLWRFDLDTLKWTFVKGDLYVNAANDYTASSNLQPNGRYYAHSWLDDYDNIWVGSGAWYRAITGFRNDLWAYALDSYPDAPNSISPIQPVPIASPASSLEFSLAIYSYRSADSCGYYQPGDGWTCVDYGQWAYPTSITINASQTWAVTDNVELDIYGDLTLASGSLLQMDIDCTIYATGKASLFGDIKLRMDMDTAEDLKDEDDPRDLVFLLISHYEFSASTKRSFELEQEGFISASKYGHQMNEHAQSSNDATRHIGAARKRYIPSKAKRDINNPLPSGKGTIAQSDCASFTYKLKDSLVTNTAEYQVLATVTKVSLSCRNSWWIALLIVLGILLGFIIIGAILVKCCRAKHPFQQMGGPNNGNPNNHPMDDEELGSPYYLPPPSAAGATTAAVVSPNIFRNDFEESNDINISDDADEESEEDEDSADMESSEQEGSEEVSEEESGEDEESYVESEEESSDY